MIFRRLGVTVAFGALVCSALPACTATANISDVWMSLDEDGARRRNVFFTDSAAITCIAEAGISRKDVTIEMLIRQLSGVAPGTDEFSPMNVVVAASEVRAEGSPTFVTLPLVPSSIDDEGHPKDDQAAPFKVGNYVCEVMLDGKIEGKAAFTIEYAPCPTKAIQSGTPCVGFYMRDLQCPASGATGDPEPTCTCQDEGWRC